jgi:glutaminyl-tRNA synthetase
MEADLADDKHGGRICTRFPPEPNGYLHIGHAKSICINFGQAKKYGGTTNLRFDDTNPAKEDVEYVDSIRDDVRWLGFEWAGEHYASDYFQFLYDYAEYLVETGRAYVCDLSDEEIREYRGNFFKAGQPSPYRDRPVAENLDLFRRMRAGEFADGARVLRAKIDVASPNMNLRDPLMYRIRRVQHHRTGHAWPIYPMYDYAHGVSDAIERITHSICTLEFEDHRPLYDWFLEQDAEGRFFQRPLPRQIEFARLNLTYTVSWSRKATCAAGTTRACPPSPGCAGAATRRRASAPSPTRWAWPSATWWPTWACWSTACARTWAPGPGAPWPCCAR